MKNVRLYRGKRPVKVAMEQLFQIVKSIEKTGKSQEFLAECEKAGIAVIAEPHVVNAVKAHLAKSEAHLTDAFADQVQQSPPPPPGGAPTCWPIKFAEMSETRKA